MSDEHHQHHSFAVEEEQPENLNLVLYGLAIIIVFFGAGILLTSLFYRTAEEAVYRKVLAPVSPQLLELRQQEEDKLTTYGYADKDKKWVRIPVERAMRLMVEESQK